MNIAIYQIDPDRDENNVAFLNYENLERFQGSAALRSEIYDKVFEGEVECGTLEEVYQMFNIGQPDGYRGRSLSVSDVGEVVGEEKSTFHFCDSIGFREVDFDPDMTEPLKEKKIKVVLCEPGKVARVAEIGTELSDLQRVVGGLIEPYYPFEEQVCIVCNDEGKYNGMRPCRAIYGEGREMMDIIFGPFFICDCSTPYFGSLNKEQLERYTKQFQNPELANLQTKQNYSDVLGYFTGLMKRLIRQSVLAEDDPEIMAAQFCLPISTWISLCDREPEREPEVMDLVEKHIRQFFKVYQPAAR